MKLGVITTSYPRFAGDPAGNFVAGHVAALRALRHEVEVIAAGDAVTAPAMETAAATATDPGHVIRVGGSRLFYRGGAPDAIERAPLASAIDGAVFTARLTAAVIARAARWDRVIAHWLVPSAIAALAVGTPIVAIAHGGDVYTLRQWGALGPVLRVLRRRGTRLVFVSEPLRAIARGAAPQLASWLERAVVQPMGIDVARFAALCRAPSEPPIVLVVARLVPVKGVDVAMAAMAHVGRPARLVIAGDGPERRRLAAGSPHSFAGEVTTARRDELLRTASVVVIPSRVLPSGRTEGTPAIALEALAAGVPVIASSVGGLRDVPGVRLVPPESPRALARAIDQLLAQPPPAAALRRAVANLDWGEIAPRLLRE